MLKFCSLASSSAGNSYFISSGSSRILIDAGISCAKIKKSLASIGERVEDLDAIFVTHEHSDHVKGLKVLLKKHPIPLFANRGTLDGTIEALGWEDVLVRSDELANDVLLTGKGVRPCEVHAGNGLMHSCYTFENGGTMVLGGGETVDAGAKTLAVTAYPVSHDAKDPVCYKVDCSGVSIGVITDLGWLSPDIVTTFQGVDFLHIESNYDPELLRMGPYPSFLKQRILGEQGHLSNEKTADIVADVLRGGRLKHVVLGHLSKQNNHPDLAYETVRLSLAEQGFVAGDDYELEVSFREQVGKVYFVRG